MNYFTRRAEELICLLCNKYCHLKKGQIGLCGVNKNTGEYIECLVYGYPTAMNIDPVEKKPLYHFLPQTKTFSIGTVGCNFKCSFCQNHSLSQDKNIKQNEYFSAHNIVSLAKLNNCDSISFTYNEPTIFYPYSKDISLEAKKNGIKSVYVSNGFESIEVINDMKGIIDAVNIDLKCFDDKYYKSLGGRLEDVLSNLKEFKKHNIWLEVTTLIVPTKNDSYEELKKIASFIKEELGADTPWHISAFHPDFRELNLPRTSIESLKMAYTLGHEVGLNYVYIGNSNFENSTICTNCNKVMIKRTYFNTIENNLIAGCCSNCNNKIPGVFK